MIARKVEEGRERVPKHEPEYGEMDQIIKRRCVIFATRKGSWENERDFRAGEQQANKRVGVGQVRTNTQDTPAMFVYISPNRVKRDGPTRTFPSVDQAMTQAVTKVTRVVL